MGNFMLYVVFTFTDFLKSGFKNPGINKQKAGFDK
jgi:hypothetical protein